MNSLIVFDSQFGNTKKIAESIGTSINHSKTVHINQITPQDLKGLDLLIVGSPTLGGQATPAIQKFLNELPNQSLKGIKVAAFDTGFHISNLGFALKLLVKVIGYAAPKIAKILVGKGGDLIIKPTTFIVTGKEGPLADGEIKRAAMWIR